MAPASSFRCRTSSSAKQARNLGITLPPAGDYGAGCVFLPRDPSARATIEALVEQIVQEEGQTLLGWRDLPTDDRLVGASAAAVAPYFKQVFVGANAPTPFPVPVPVPGASNPNPNSNPDPNGNRNWNPEPSWFERKLYVIRKRIEHAVDTAADLDAPTGSISTSPACRRTR